MSELKDKFLHAAERVQTLSKAPPNESKLKLYSLYKQALVGDNTTAMPGMFDFKGKAKWEAWNSLKGKVTSEQAMKEYIEFVDHLFSIQNQ